jgi:hypothetical protein
MTKRRGSTFITSSPAQVGVSLISFTRLNLDDDEASEWKDVVYGFREISDRELKKFGRLHGNHGRVGVLWSGTISGTIV